MCGVAGIVSRNKQTQSHVEDMVAALMHRGPDDQGFYYSDEISLGHSRLSIIDIASGAQPMYNADKTLVLIFNGEIYNYIELREDLKKKGRTFFTDSDTEVLLHLYEEYGIGMLEYLNGMFACAIYDIQKKELFVARDRIGIKPLYYYHQNGLFSFASEIPALEKVKEIRETLSINNEAIWHYFSLLYIPQPITIFNEINMLPSGHYMLYKNGRLDIQQYWQPDITPKKWNSLEDCSQELKKLIDSAVHLRMRSDVPYGAYLSGGVDSSLIVSHMTDHADEPVKTFMARVKSQELDEKEYAQAIAEKFETEHAVIDIEDIDFGLVEQLISYFGQPFADSSIIPTYLISIKTREQVTVVLGGDGGDELFSGYDKYSLLCEDDSDATIKKAFLNRVPMGIKEKIFTQEFLASVQDQDTFNFLISHPHNNNYKGYNLLRFLDIEFFLKSDILTKVDQMSMANSLEARVPLLDHRIIEFALQIPEEYLISKERNKIILKHLLEKCMPVKFVNRQKVGFMLPISEWLGKFVDRIPDLEIPQSLEYIFNKQKINDLVQEYKAGKNELGNILFAYVVFYYWTNSYKNLKLKT